jgi:apolipoprotein N-acyltransferase
MADRSYQTQLIALIDDLGSDLLFGSPDYNMENGNEDFYNSVFLVSPDAKLRGKYDKIHLVPFGEYVPFRRLLFFVRPIIDQIGDITPGQQITLMQTEKGACGTPICFEIIFPDLVRRFVKAGAVFIVTLTNDNWFGRSSAPYQHFSMAVFRAVENRVPVVRSANSGISGVIAADGKIKRQSGIFVEDVIVEEMGVGQGATPSFYTTYGDLFSYLCIAVSIVMILLSFFFKPKEERAPSCS